jgi:hypothetical protein
MKTPRQILYEHHAPAAADLERIQQQALAMGLRKKNESFIVSSKQNVFRLLFSPAVWAEVFHPARQIWAGFALVWVAIVAVNLSMETLTVSGVKMNPAPASAILTSYKEHQRILAELTGPTIRPMADRPRSSAPKPQSSRKIVISIA